MRRKAPSDQSGNDKSVKKAAARTRIRLDDSPGVVRYVQLAGFIRHKIASNEWPVGKMLPTIQEFSEELGIAKVTVRQAYAILVRENLITSERGRGSHVKGVPAAPADEVRAAINNWLEVPDGFKIRILKKEDSLELPSELQLAGKPAPKYVRLKKLHLHNKQIICVAEFFVASEIFARFPKGSEKENKIAWLLPKYSLDNMKSLHQVITVSQADNELAKLLHYTFAAPIAKVKRCITNNMGTIVYASTTWYRGDHFIFDMTMPVHIMYGRQLNTASTRRNNGRKGQS